MQAQKIDKNDENAITLDDNREEFFAKLEEECEEIRREMAEEGKRDGTRKEG